MAEKEEYFNNCSSEKIRPQNPGMRNLLFWFFQRQIAFFLRIDNLNAG